MTPEANAIRAVVFDLDGVIRHFDPANQRAVEMEHGLASGVLASAAFAPDLARAVLTGKISRREWGRLIGESIGSLPAAVEWLGKPARVDVEMVDMFARMRRVESPPMLCLLTNGTDETASELRATSLDQRFDRVFNSAAIGCMKPSPEIYRHVQDELGLLPDQIFFTDDSQRNVQAARDAGWIAHHFTNRSWLEQALRLRVRSRRCEHLLSPDNTWVG